MRMVRKTWLMGLCGIVVLSAPAFTYALRIAVPNLSTPQKTMKAELIVAGKVVEIEKDNVEVEPAKGAPNKITYQVGVLKINDALLGGKNVTQVRVGWQPAPEGGVNPAVDRLNAPAVLPIRRPAPFQFNQALTKDQEGIFFLKKHPVGDFYVLVQFATPIDKKAENYDKELASVKQVVKVIDKPMDALKSEKAAERQFAAAVLLNRYAAYPENAVDPKNQPKQEPIDEAESKLIMKALSEMEWGTGGADAFTQLSTLFYQLGLTDKDGWKQPVFNGQGDFNKMMKEAFDKWYKESGDKFRVKHWVVPSK